MGEENSKFSDGKLCGRVITLADLKTIMDACDLVIDEIIAQGIETFTPSAMEGKLQQKVLQLAKKEKIVAIVDGDIGFLVGIISYAVATGFSVASIQHTKVSTNKTWDISKFNEN